MAVPSLAHGSDEILIFSLKDLFHSMLLSGPLGILVANDKAQAGLDL